jgi:hypothetical protein
VAAVAALLCAAALSKDKGKASQEKAKVTITNNKFEPKPITVKAVFGGHFRVHFHKWGFIDELI